MDLHSIEIKMHHTRRPITSPTLGKTELKLDLAYQPVIDTAIGNHHAVAFEALLRVRANGQLNSPANLLSEAEQDGSIVQLDRWVLNQVVQLVRMRPSLRVWINTSQISIADPTYLADAIQTIILTKTMGRISFELTETADVDTRLLAARLTMLRHRAINVMIDDVRDGHAKQGLLLNPAVAGCKLSRDSMLELHYSEKARAEVEQLARICKRERKNLVLEGLETQDDVELAKSLGITWCQGYFFTRPAPSSALSHFPQMLETVA